MRYHIFSRTSKRIRNSWTCEKCGFEVISHSTPYYVGDNLMISTVSGNAYIRVSHLKSDKNDCNHILIQKIMSE